MPREAALKARESLRATINEEHLSGIEEIVGRKRAPPRRFGADASDHDYAGPKRSKKAIAFPSKRMRCGDCEGCHAANCGKCRFCKDMPQFGGRNIMRQSCAERKCRVIAEEEARKAAERRNEREIEREARQVERDARLAEVAEAKAKARAERELRYEKVAANQMLSAISGASRAKGGARLPSVSLDAASISGGWGMHNVAIGDHVEVKLDDEGLAGAYWSATILEDNMRDEGDAKCGDTTGDVLGGKGVANGAGGANEAGGVDGERGPGKVLVEFDELLTDEEVPTKLREWIELGAIRLHPPDEFPCGAVDLLRKGDVVELFFEDGWWEVAVESVAPSERVAFVQTTPRETTAFQTRDQARNQDARGDASSEDENEEDGDVQHENAGGNADYVARALARRQGAGKRAPERFQVKAIEYDKVHTVSHERLRPRWLWAADARAWRYELVCGHGCVPLQGNGRPSFRFASGILRAIS